MDETLQDAWLGFAINILQAIILDGRVLLGDGVNKFFISPRPLYIVCRFYVLGFKI